MSRNFGWIDLCPHTKLAGVSEFLAEGRLVGSRCRSCGRQSFPPRADCAACLGAEFEFVEVEPRGHLLTFTRIAAAPAGFEELAPYTLGVLELTDGGRLLAWLGESIDPENVEIGMPLLIVPHLVESHQGARVLYTLEADNTC